MREILVLGETDVEELLDPAGCLDAVERALVALTTGDVHLPLRLIVRPPGEESLIGLMPVHRGGGERLYGLKTVVIIPENSARGLDPHQGTVTLFDGETGQAIAVMNASPITAIRTAAASALATRELAREDARALAIVGAGYQAKAHLEALVGVRPFDDIRIASRTHAKAEELAEHHPSARAVAAEEAVRGADVIATVTSSADPVIAREWVADGTHINAVGACFPNTRELDSDTVAASTFIADRRESAENESGDYRLALADGAIAEGHIAAELGDVLTGAHAGRTSADEITVFESLGVAVEDLFAAEYVVRRAREAGRGIAADFLISIDEIRRAAEAIAGGALRTPLVRAQLPGAPCEIWLKLECLQPVGAFKIRGALNAIRQAPEEALAAGVVTPSAGNMGQAVAWAAGNAGVGATIVAPDHAPRVKLAAIERLGGRVVTVPFERWWQVMEEGRFEGHDEFFVHPVRDVLVMAGNGTIGLEIIDDLAELDAVVIPVGGGGLLSGIASAVKVASPGTRIVAVEPETAAPLAASLAAGAPTEIAYQPSFVDGAGGRSILPGMWPLLQEVVDEAVTVSLGETAQAVRLLLEHARVVAEGAGALATAAALAGRAGSGRVVCIVSGGNIDAPVLARIAGGDVP